MTVKDVWMFALLGLRQKKHIGDCSRSLRVNFGCCIFRLYSLAMFWDLFCILFKKYLQSNDVLELLSTELYLAHDCPEVILPCKVWPSVLPTFFMFLIYFSSISTHTNWKTSLIYTVLGPFANVAASIFCWANENVCSLWGTIWTPSPGWFGWATHRPVM